MEITNYAKHAEYVKGTIYETMQKRSTKLFQKTVSFFFFNISHKSLLRNIDPLPSIPSPPLPME